MGEVTLRLHHGHGPAIRQVIGGGGTGDTPANDHHLEVAAHSSGTAIETIRGTSGPGGCEPKKEPWSPATRESRKAPATAASARSIRREAWTAMASRSVMRRACASGSSGEARRSKVWETKSARRESSLACRVSSERSASTA